MIISAVTEKPFPTKKGQSIGGKKSLKSTTVINKVNKTVQDLIEEEFSPPKNVNVFAAEHVRGQKCQWQNLP